MPMTAREQLLQAAHEEAHPGRRCMDCPIEVASRRDLFRLAHDRAERQYMYGNIVGIAIVFTALILAWVFR